MTAAAKEALASKHLLALYHHWESLRGSAPAPPKAAFDVVEAPRAAVPWLILLETMAGGADFRYRLIGTGIVTKIGRDFTGERISEYHLKHESAAVLSGYQQVAAQVVPHHFRGSLRRVGREHVAYERLALPLLEAGGSVDFILAGFAFGTPYWP